ncbi:MAG: 30S ribosomal protein S7 [Candidatus Woesebacteria bacterium GW2011_GWB1_40_101]|uniref:Small ribosomal subunit protein uS7 n=1 Tax=Candidatus Woesebacteria bacterium GW2011_GWB1_40_101 TaxID=1618575 RepID=A0A0G0QPT5_9BACT|nr:MAG: 30S ribosomal protein S7 [Candidatus Woesebacteria bacterium GW2011_GWB1_40_101]
MARRGQTKPREAIKDPFYGSELVTKLINRSMNFEIIKEKAKEDPLNVFNQAIENIKPTMEVRPRRVGGAAYQVPISVRGPRRESLGIRWLIFAARSRSNSEYHTFAEKLATEIMDAAKGEGAAVKKRQDMERVAEANRAFAHFRW